MYVGIEGVRRLASSLYRSSLRLNNCAISIKDKHRHPTYAQLTFFKPFPRLTSAEFNISWTASIIRKRDYFRKRMLNLKRAVAYFNLCGLHARD
jgi:hypothetical protein